MSQQKQQSRQFVDFKVLRKSLSFAAVLKHYGIEPRIQKGNRHVGICPLPGHTGQKKGRSFSAKLDWGVWQCFSCKGRGNILDFAVLMEGLNPQDSQDLRKVALVLQERFGMPDTSQRTKAAPVSVPQPRGAVKPLPILVNPPLDFELKNLDYDHPYLPSRGFTPDTIRTFGLGYCNRGLMKGRVVIPLHDQSNRLVGYAGRIVDDTLINEFNPKYKLPATREHNAQVLSFNISNLVYNANRLRGPVDELIVVQGFPACWWLVQNGYENTVALMGASCSAAQAKIISSSVIPEGRVWILADATDSGDHCAESAYVHLAEQHWMHRPHLQRGEQPTDCMADELEVILT